MSFDIGKLQKMAIPASKIDRQEAEERYENREARRYSSLIALAVRRELRLKGITQQALAEQLGFSAQYLGKILKGKENLTLETIGKLERVLGHPLIEVFQQEESITPSKITYVFNFMINDSDPYVKAPLKKNHYSAKFD